MKQKGLTATHLKLIAIVAMLLDHIIAPSPISHDTYWGMILRIPGRVTAPIMCYMISEGFHHTSNQRKYLCRLLVFAFISHIPYNLCLGNSFPITSVMWSLAMGLAALMSVKNDRLHRWVKPVAVIAFCALSFYANWNFVAVLWIVFFGIYHGNFKKQIISFTVIGILFHIVPTFTYLDYGLMHQEIPHWYQLFIFLAIPLLVQYNGQKGNFAPWVSHFFYWFYPAHLLLIYIINRMIRF